MSWIVCYLSVILMKNYLFLTDRENLEIRYASPNTVKSAAFALSYYYNYLQEQTIGLDEITLLSLGSQGVQTLVKRYKKKEQKVKQAEKDGKQAEAGNTLENYDSEMNSAAQKSQEAKEASKKEESGDFGDGTSGFRFQMPQMS